MNVPFFLKKTRFCTDETKIFIHRQTLMPTTFSANIFLFWATTQVRPYKSQKPHLKHQFPTKKDQIPFFLPKLKKNYPIYLDFKKF
jgi:hypothetical protein